jgi:amino acid transporter
MAKQSVFIRTASGLVREYGAFDSFLMGTFVTWGLLWAVVQFPWFYGYFPGANLPLGLLIVTPPFLLYGIIYWVLSVSMPRAGADYMWVSRSIGPTIGFAWSLMWFVAFFYNAFVYPVLAFESLIATALAVPGKLFGRLGGSTMLLACF